MRQREIYYRPGIDVASLTPRPSDVEYSKVSNTKLRCSSPSQPGAARRWAALGGMFQFGRCGNPQRRCGRGGWMDLRNIERISQRGQEDTAALAATVPTMPTIPAFSHHGAAGMLAHSSSPTVYSSSPPSSSPPSTPPHRAPHPGAREQDNELLFRPPAMPYTQPPSSSFSPSLSTVHLELALPGPLCLPGTYDHPISLIGPEPAAMSVIDLTSPSPPRAVSGLLSSISITIPVVGAAPLDSEDIQYWTESSISPSTGAPVRTFSGGTKFMESL